ncbi:hypothetical protein H5410_009825 [Solanum commersonii]|uniref:Uncharacterized protein n=1 Tax=Solanum commersonii TaxID=4109 RepID=A0A9J6AKS2_SOLCO|nr:hypothetical protein H5410_009825 [Solanum commersonii]
MVRNFDVPCPVVAALALANFSPLTPLKTLDAISTAAPPTTLVSCIALTLEHIREEKKKSEECLSIAFKELENAQELRKQREVE